MKVGILTFYYADNYGAMLQAYALHRYIQNNGAEAYFVPYIPANEQRAYSIDPLKGYGAKDKLRRVMQLGARMGNYRAFKAFRENCIPVGNGNDNPDVVIVGSDQVWNEKIVDVIALYMLDWVPETCKKASYAASCGTAEVSEATLAAMRTHLQSFTAVSVREQATAQVLAGIGVHAEAVADPVFLLPADVWTQIESAPDGITADKGFVLLYLLRRDNAAAAAAAEYAERHGQRLYVIHPMGAKMTDCGTLLNGVGPREFVWLIHHAGAVFSNSFHAASFSVIFEKPLCTFANGNLGGRVSNLLGYVERREMDGGIIVPMADSPELCALIEHSKEFIDNILK